MNPKILLQKPFAALFDKNRVFFLYLIPLLFSLSLNKADAQNQKPNIIFILADDVGYKSLTCDGGNLYSTPNIDKLAQKGMRFTECHASPTCSPSRFLLLTGKYNFRNYTEWGTMDRNQKTLGNMFKDAGYKTAYFGKWQLNGGDESVRAFGFDNYIIHDPFTSAEGGSRYESPHLYTHGNFLDDSLTAGKYSEDIFTDSLLDFIKSNKNNPFFIYFPMNLVHMPFSPTPDDSEFESWPLKGHGYDTSFFPSMMSYMDKKIGEIVNKLKLLGIDSNTVILFSGDNGTPGNVSDYADENDSLIAGGKGKTTEAGTHVPLIVRWPGVVAEGAVNNDLIGFTDILPTLAGIAHIPLPDYGPLDGISFAPRLTNNAGTPRKSLFYHYEPHPELNGSELKRWAQNTTYKLYDTSYYNDARLFYNMITDPGETNPIPNNLLTSKEVSIKQQLLDVINKYVGQGVAIVDSPEVVTIGSSSAKILSSVLSNGGSGITASGAVWDTAHRPALPGNDHTSENMGKGEFYSLIDGLKGHTTYYVRTYATNVAGTVYSKEISFVTSYAPPVCIDATAITNRGFTANWTALTGVKNYKIDVSTSPTFTTPVPQPGVAEGFKKGIARVPEGWTFDKKYLETDTIRFGKASPSICFKQTGGSITTAIYPWPVTKLSFWIEATKDNPGSLLVEGSDGLTWTTIDNITDIPAQAVTKTYDSVLSSLSENGFTSFRFSFIKGNGHLFFDDVKIHYDSITPSFVPGYQDSVVVTNSLNITGLKKDIPYYYRVRAAYKNATSGYSNIIKAITCKLPSISNLLITNPGCDGDSSGAIDLSATGKDLAYYWKGPGGFTSTNEDIKDLVSGDYHLSITSNNTCATDTTVNLSAPTCEAAMQNESLLPVNVFPNPAINEFTLTVQTGGDKPVQIIVTDLYGKIVYGSSGYNKSKYVFGKSFAPGTYFVQITQDNVKKTIKLVKLNR